MCLLSVRLDSWEIVASCRFPVSLGLVGWGNSSKFWGWDCSGRASGFNCRVQPHPPSPDTTDPSKSLPRSPSIRRGILLPIYARLLSSDSRSIPVTPSNDAWRDGLGRGVIPRAMQHATKRRWFLGSAHACEPMMTGRKGMTMLCSQRN